MVENDPLELPPLQRAARFRKYADEMISRASEAASEEQKVAYLKLAAEWLKLAEGLLRQT
jgi:hypothetical protein